MAFGDNGFSTPENQGPHASPGNIYQAHANAGNKNILDIPYGTPRVLTMFFQYQTPPGHGCVNAAGNIHCISPVNQPVGEGVAPTNLFGA